MAFQFVCVGASSALGLECDDTCGSPCFDRLTALLACAGDGNPLPMFCVIKCGSASHDLSGTRVIQNLHREEPFSGWHLGAWRKELTLEVSGKTTTKTYVRPYIQSDRGHVVTTQHKAWNDTVGTGIAP